MNKFDSGIQTTLRRRAMLDIELAATTRAAYDAIPLTRVHQVLHWQNLESPQANQESIACLKKFRALLQANWDANRLLNESCHRDLDLFLAELNQDEYQEHIGALMGSALRADADLQVYFENHLQWCDVVLRICEIVEEQRESVLIFCDSVYPFDAAARQEYEQLRRRAQQLLDAEKALHDHRISAYAKGIESVGLGMALA